MKIVLMNPPLARYYVQNADEPLHLEYLCSLIRNMCEVFIVDGYGRRLTVDETVEEVLNLSPHIVGISLAFSGAYSTTSEICRKIKAKNPETNIMLGGNTATFLADTLIINPDIDIILRGEADISFPMVINALINHTSPENVPGITCKTKRDVIRNNDVPLVKDLDTLPFPARDMLPYKNSYNRIILTTRGCSYGCPYCSASAFWKRHARMRSPENVLKEITTLENFEELTSFSFCDDCFTINTRRVRTICRGLSALKMNAVWGCSGRIETVSRDLLMEMNRAGCRSMFFGIESGSLKILKILKRHYTPDDVVRVYKDCLESGIRPSFSFIVGLPYEDKQDLEETYKLIQKLKGVESGLHILTPFPGTPIAEHPEDFELDIQPHNIEDLDINTRSLIATSKLTTHEIQNAYRSGIGYSLETLRHAPLRKSNNGDA